MNVQKVVRPGERTLPVFAEAERVLARIQRRAFELFTERAAVDGQALGDWLAAEHEASWPAAELLEHDEEYVLSIALPGFEPGDIEVTAASRELLVHAKSSSERIEGGKGSDGKLAWSEFHSSDVWRRVELPADILVREVKAALKNGVLKIVAPKAKVAATAVPKTAVA